MNEPKKMLIITGSAPCVMDDLHDLAAIGDHQDQADLMALGLDAVDKYPWPIRYVATFHPEDIPEIFRRRTIAGGNRDFKVISHQQKDGVDIVISDYWDPSGSSALLGVQAALQMGYERIILCGCPLTGKDHTANGANNYEVYRKGWEVKKAELDGLVKSMSGWTRDILGSPTEEWLAPAHPAPAITIGACWDGRDYYPPEYVNRLYRACLRNTTIPFDFVLYVGPEAEKPGRTNAIDKAIRIVPVSLPFWWSQLKFWQPNPPGIRTDAILYLDLDQVIIGSLDDLIRYPSAHCYMKDFPSHACPPGREHDANNSTALIRNNGGAKVWEEYVNAGMPTWDPFLYPGLQPLPLAGLSIMNDPKYGVKYDLFPENWICSYKLEVQKRGIPEDCRIVVFHGRPKPHEVDEPFVKEHWR